MCIKCAMGHVLDNVLTHYLHVEIATSPYITDEVISTGNNINKQFL